MTSNTQLNEKLKNAMEGTKHWKEGTSQKLQTLSFMTLLWPLLPNLPPEPPRGAAGLLKNNALDDCDVCGTIGLPVKQQHSGKPVEGVNATSPLAQMMAEIEKKMDETLASIENTTQTNAKLNENVKKLEMADYTNITDEDLVNTLKSLMKEKSSYEERVKILESKEKELKDSLNTAIDWAKKVDGKN